MNSSKLAIVIADAIALRARYMDLSYIDTVAPSVGSQAWDIVNDWREREAVLHRLGLYDYVVSTHERNMDYALGL